MTDVIQQLRTEMNETVNDRIDMLSSINTALQNVSAKPMVSKPYRISDFIPRKLGKAATRKDNSDISCRTCTCGCERGQTTEKRCLSALRALTSSTNSHTCSGLFRSGVQKQIDASVLPSLAQNRKTSHWRVQHTRGQKAWHVIVRIYDPRTHVRHTHQHMHH